MPRNGRITIRKIQPALPQPDRSSRRKMSAKTPMNIQMNRNQKKKTSIAQSTSPKDQSTAYLLACGRPDASCRCRPCHPSVSKYAPNYAHFGGTKYEIVDLGWLLCRPLAGLA